MKASSYISKGEHKLLLIVAFATFIFSIAGAVAYTNKANTEREAYFKLQDEKIANNEPVFSGPYCHPDKHPQFLFSIILLLGLTFSSLCVAKRYLLSSLLTIASLSRFVYWYIDTKKLFFSNEITPFEGLDGIFYKAGEFDLTVFLLVSILLFWQISILLRMLIKTLQKEKALP